MARGFHDNPQSTGEIFRTDPWDTELRYTTVAKTKQFNWGLLKGKLEVK
jgi:hypothetical protein